MRFEHCQTAALHFESQVGFAFSIGGQVGQCGHSRKLFSDHLKCLLAVIKQQTKEKLTTCLPSTGLPRPYSLAQKAA